MGNSSPVAQKGTRSNYRSTRIFKSTLLHKFVFLGWAVYKFVFPGPGPDPFGLAWGARVLGRTLLVWLGGPGSWAGPAYTINKLDSDKDVNIIRFRDLTVIRMLI